MKRLLMMLLAAVAALGCGGSGKPAQMSGKVTTVGVEEFAKIIAQEDIRLLDVRTPKEYAEGHLEGAENIDFKAADFAERVKEVNGSVAVYCLRGGRSLKAANLLAAQGCTVYNLNGGITAWLKAGKAVTH